MSEVTANHCMLTWSRLSYILFHVKKNKLCGLAIGELT